MNRTQVNIRPTSKTPNNRWLSSEIRSRRELMLIY